MALKRPAFHYVDDNSFNPHIKLVVEWYRTMNLSLDMIIKDTSFVSPQRSISGQVYKNVFKKKKEDIQSNYSTVLLMLIINYLRMDQRQSILSHMQWLQQTLSLSQRS